MITPTASFSDNLQLLPAIDAIARIDLLDRAGAVVATVENLPGKKGSLAVYAYLGQEFGRLDAEAAAHGLQVFGEHTADAEQRPGAHPNIDRLFALREGGEALEIRVIPLG